MTNVLPVAYLSEICVYGGHSVALFLMSARKYSFRESVFLWSGVFLFSILFSILTYSWMSTGAILLNHVVSVGICALVFLISTKGNFMRNLFVFATYINFFLCSFAISQTLAANFVDNNLVAALEFRLLIHSVFCLVLVYDIRPAFFRSAVDIPRGWGTLTILVCIFCACLMAMAYISNMFSTVSPLTYTMLIVLFVIMASAYIVIFKTIGALSKENRKRQLELESKYLNHQLSNYEQMERESQKHRHDFRHHNLLILEYAKKQDCDAIIRYLQEYEKVSECKLGRKFCHNMTVNSIVSAFFKQAHEQGIRMSTNIRMRSETSVRDTDLVAILSNLLENAVKGCLLAEEHWIDLTILHRGSKLMIQCSNSCEKDIRFLNGLPQATGRRGIGITSIVDAVAVYAGNADFSAENGVFTSRLLLNDPEEETN